MLWSRRPLKLRHLIAAWVSYWLLLAGATLGPAIAAIWKATHAGPDQGSVSMGFVNSLLTLVVTVNGETIYSAGVSILTLTLLIAGPPLAIFLLWLMRARRQEPAREPVM